MKEFLRGGVCMAACCALLVGVMGTDAQADGTETLGTPSIAIGSGTGIVVAGTGTVAQPGNIDIDVPGTVVQALLYWAGEGDELGDDTITVDFGGGPGDVVGTLIGGPTLFFFFNGPVYNTTFRADVTDQISSGLNSLTITDMDYSPSPLGAGLMVIYDTGDVSVIDVVDGQDLAFARFAPPLDATVPQTFTFDAVAFDREAEVSMFFGSVGEEDRPSLLRFSTDAGNVVEYVNFLGSNSGPLWDTVQEGIPVPAGATSLTVEVISLEDGSGLLPASLTWVAAGLEIMPDPCVDLDCDDGDPCTDDRCEDGVCINDPIVCDDGDACTEDACVEGICVYTEIVCDDGDACTDDACVDGVCVYDDIVCDDGDACTDDACVDGICVFTEIVCDDGDACTEDYCEGGVCMYDEIVCDDGDDCTEDSCVDGVCVYDEIVCDDGDACTEDYCEGGVCMYDEIVCDDGDDCTEDSCVDGVCVYDEIVCDDGDACTEDYCEGGVCMYDEIVCDDGDPCTDDSCVDGDCQYIDNGTCRDLYACTPGFWRQPQWRVLWPEPYMPENDFDTVFGTDLYDPDITLLAAIWHRGGGLGKLARHATAALLNAAATDYPMTVDEVIAAVQSIVDDESLDDVAAMFADHNEMWDCPFGREDVWEKLGHEKTGGSFRR